MKPISRSLCIAIILYSGLVGVAAANRSIADQDEIDRRERAADRASETPGKEMEVGLPAPPQENNLQPLLSQRIGSGYRYFIDVASISVTEDKIVLYTVIIASPSGVNSGFFEGLRCTTGQFKTYAYLTANGEIKRRSMPLWKFIRDHSRGVYAYRLQLAQVYLCDQNGFSNTPAAIEAALIRYRPGSLWVDQLDADRQSTGGR